MSRFLVHKFSQVIARTLNGICLNDNYNENRVDEAVKAVKKRRKNISEFKMIT